MPIESRISELASAKRFQFVGGTLALDFCNTVGGKRGQTTREHLGSCIDFIAWSQQAGLLSDPQARKCLRHVVSRPNEVAAGLTRATCFREALFRIFAAIIENKPPARADLAVLNAELARALGRLRLGKSSGPPALAWEWSEHEGALDRPLGPIAHEAAKLLTDSRALSQLRMCHGDNCGWLFLDSTKNHSRRWCDMRDCGNRAKIRRHRQKLRNGSGVRV